MGYARYHVIILSVFFSAVTCAGLRGKVAKEILEETVERSARRSGREITEGVAKRQAVKSLDSLVTHWGDDALKIIGDGGFEFLESVPKYGDEAFGYAMKATPAGRRAIAGNLSEMMPLLRKVGVEAAELEAKAPGLARPVFELFGDKGGKIIAANVPAGDIPRLLKYGEMAENSGTRELLLKSYAKEGRGLFERIPPKLVLASGLTASMIYGTHRGTEPLHQLGKEISENSDLSFSALRYFFFAGFLLILFVVFMVMGRFHLLPWHASAGKASSAKVGGTVRKNTGRAGQINVVKTGKRHRKDR